jgi:hypothetical protein
MSNMLGSKHTERISDAFAHALEVGLLYLMVDRISRASSLRIG